jgi:hypothetical protein
MRFVALKTEAQLDVQGLHCVPDRLVGQLTAMMNRYAALCSSVGSSCHRAGGGCSTHWG